MEQKKSQITQALVTNWKTVGLLCLTLGLAPFTPEPHFWGKLKWVFGGANGMQVMDWFDFLFHGTPWFLALFILVIKLKDYSAKRAH